MKNGVIAALLIVAILAGMGAGYLAGATYPPNQAGSGRCTPTGSLGGFIPAGVIITVSYQGDWRLAVAEFTSNQTRASALSSVCYYEGNGTDSFYVSIANYQGWNTVIALAHKWGTNGTLTVNVAVGPQSTVTNSTSLPYGDASASLWFFR